MKRENIHIFKLTHTCLKDDDNIFIKSEISEADLVKLIKVIQRKATDIEETFDLLPSEMRDLLIQYDGIRAYPKNEDLKELKAREEDEFDFIEIDLYNVWEAADIVVLNEEVYDNKYENENVTGMIKEYINAEMY